MAVLASSIISKVARTLVDRGFTRWDQAELLDHLNDAQVQIVTMVPPANSIRQDLTLAAGASQTIPADGIQLIDVIGNKNGDAITIITKDDLVAVRPGWRTEPQTSAIVHYLFDQRTPKVFDVYPPAQAGAIVEIAISTLPNKVASPNANISIADEYEAAIYEFMLFRAYSKDEQNQAYAVMSTTHYTAFLESLGYKAKNEIRFNPNSCTINQQGASA